MVKRPSFLLALGAFFLSAAVARGLDAPAISFSPPEWKFGMIMQGAKVETTVTATNASDAPVNVTFIATCSCLSIEPAARTVPSNGKGTFVLRYDSSDDVGNVAKGFVVLTDVKGAKPLYYALRGTVRGVQAAPSSPAGVAAPKDAAPSLFVYYYYTPGCRSCEEFLATELPRLGKEYSVSIVVQKKDVQNAAVFKELTTLAAERNDTVRAVPVLRIGDRLLQGDKEIREKLPGLLAVEGARPASAAAAQPPAAAAPASTPPPAAPEANTPAPEANTPGPAAPLVAERLAILPVIAAGLIDGINPCAFTTLIFLIAALALGGRGRREVLLIGTLFSFAVFLTYLAIGLGFLAALRAAAAVPLVSVLLRWGLVAVLLVFAGLSVRDYFLVRAGRPSEMLLQLPTALKRRIHSSIRARVRTAAVVGSSLVLGFLVSVFEFACTGQVYLPLLGYLVRIRRQLDAFGLLVLYNLCFIAPLLVVFAASFAGVSSARIASIFQAHMGKVKLGLAAVFVGLAVFTLVG